MTGPAIARQDLRPAPRVVRCRKRDSGSAVFQDRVRGQGFSRPAVCGSDKFVPSAMTCSFFTVFLCSKPYTSQMPAATIFVSIFVSGVTDRRIAPLERLRRTRFPRTIFTPTCERARCGVKRLRLWRCRSLKRNNCHPCRAPPRLEAKVNLSEPGDPRRLWHPSVPILIASPQIIRRVDHQGIYALMSRVPTTDIGRGFGIACHIAREDGRQRPNGLSYTASI